MDVMSKATDSLSQDIFPLVWDVDNILE